MGTIRKHEVRIIVAASLVLLAVLAAAIAYGAPLQTSSLIPKTQDAMAMEGVNVVVAGQAERTASGYEVPIDVTNHREDAISIKDMKVIITLTDLSSLNATCRGPDSVAPGTTERFLVMINDLRDIEIFVIDMLQGDHYLRAVMPVVSPVLVLPDVPQVDVPDDDEQTPTDPPDETPGSEPQDPVKTEPVIVTSLDDGLPLRPAYYEGDPPVFGEPVSGRVITQAVQDGDATDIAVYVHLTDLSPGQASIYASYAGGAPVAVQLIGDGGSGCYGLLIDDPSMAGSNWTWHYGGSGSAYHNISIAVTTYGLGTHELRLYAYDAATGVRISEVEVTRYTVYGSGGGSGLFDTELTSDIEDPFVPGAVYNLTFVDSCRCDGYSGSVRSVFKCPYAVNVWLVGGDGEETLLTPSSLGEYLITWTFDGSAPHEIRLRVQLGEAGGSYPASIGQYWLEDVSTGMILSPVSGEGVEGTTFSVRGPEPPLP